MAGPGNRALGDLLFDIAMPIAAECDDRCCIGRQYFDLHSACFDVVICAASAQHLESLEAIHLTAADV